MADNNLATKTDIVRIDKQLIAIEGELKWLKWMSGLLLAGVTALILKSFFF